MDPVEILGDDEPHNKKNYLEEEEEIKGIDFGEVPLVDKNTTHSLIEDENFDFQVTNPQLINGHIAYHVRGIDKQGVWEGLRRFNEFFQLH